MPKQTAEGWLKRIDDYQRAFEPWVDGVQRVVDRYRLEREMSRGQTGSTGMQRPTDFNILWSNTETVRPAIFSRLPQLVAERRHKDKDPVGRIASEVIQRAGNEEMEGNNFELAFEGVTLDVLLAARGVPWVRFEADEDPESGSVVNERTMVDYVHWDDFAHSNDRTWADVKRAGWVARRIALSRAEGMERFGRAFKDVELSKSARTANKKRGDNVANKGEGKYGEVWEVWDAPTRRRLFVAKGVSKPLEETDDPYQLDSFFPCPRPAYGSLSNEDLRPTPDYLQYEGLAAELDRITKRIRRITEQLKVVGIYDASAPSLAQMLKGQDGTLVAVDNMQAIAAKNAAGGGQGGTLNGMVNMLDIAPMAQTLLNLYTAREQAKQALYEVSGLSDVLRGQVDPREKASQTRQKAQFASQRLEKRRMSVAKCARDTARIQVEIMVELYSPDTLREQSGFDQLDGIVEMEDGEREMLWERVVQLIRSNKARDFRIDIETDSTVELDAADTREARTEFLQSAGNFMNNALQVIQAAPDFAPLVGEMLLFTVRGYRAGRTLESHFEDAVKKVQQSIQQQQQAEAQGQGQEQPDPEAQAKAAAVQQKAQVDAAVGQAKVQQMQQKTALEAQQGQMQLEQERADTQKAILQLQKAVLELQNARQMGMVQ